jgi:hypothetical protein
MIAIDVVEFVILLLYLISSMQLQGLEEYGKNMYLWL